MKTYNYNGLNVYLKATSYANNGSLAVQMLSGDDNEFYDVITVNLGSFLQTEQLAFVDDNNLPGIGQWLESNGDCNSDRILTDKRLLQLSTL